MAHTKLGLWAVKNVHGVVCGMNFFRVLVDFVLCNIMWVGDGCAFNCANVFKIDG